MLKLSYPREGTQQSIVLASLIQAKGGYVKAFKLSYEAKSIAVHSVVSKLRENHGWSILNNREYITSNGKVVCHSSYALPEGQIEQQLTTSPNE